MAKSKDMTGAFLALIGSLVYLYVVWQWMPNLGSLWTAGSTTATFWLPIFAGLGAAVTFSVLVISIIGLMGMKNDMAIAWGMRATFGGAIALFALGGVAWFWYVAVGFILLQFGFGKMMM
jgi:hypothetical protein